MSESIVVVDDNPTNLKLIAFVLRKSGYEVRTALSAAAALALLDDFSPQLILLDLQMPEQDGYELARRLKKDPRTRRVPLVAVTANAMAGDEQRATAAGCDGYITKPIDTRGLSKLVASYMGHEV